VIDFDVDGQ